MGVFPSNKKWRIIMGKIVDFMCVGAPKAGTSSLHHILVQHPDIFLPEIKETGFFMFDDLYNNGIEFYKNEYFKKRGDEKIAGEIDPSYMFPDYVAERIYEAFGEDLKLIFMFRNPVDRAYSHYWMNVRRVFEDVDFASAIEDSDKRCEHNVENRKYCYVEMGLYAKRVKNFLKYFKKENMFFIVFENDFLKNREQTIKKILEFLEVNPDVPLNLKIKANPAKMPVFSFVGKLLYHESIFKKFARGVVKSRVNRAKIKKSIYKIMYEDFVPPILHNEVKLKWIDRFFIEDIKELEKIIDRDLSVWYRNE